MSFIVSDICEICQFYNGTSDCCPSEGIFRLYHGENKLHFDEIMSVSY